MGADSSRALGSDFDYLPDGSVGVGAVVVSPAGVISSREFDRLPAHDPLWDECVRDECVCEGSVCSCGLRFGCADDWAVFDANHVQVARGSFDYCYREHYARYDAPTGLAIVRCDSLYYRIYGKGGK